MNAAIIKNVSVVEGKKKNEKVNNKLTLVIFNYVAQMLLNIQFLSAQLFTLSGDPNEHYIKNLDMIKHIYTDDKIKGTSMN